MTDGDRSKFQPASDRRDVDADGPGGTKIERSTIYVRNRYYDPDMGRFIQADPMGYVDGPNQYQFALNNPVDLSDPMGLESVGIRQNQAMFRSVGLDYNEHLRGQSQHAPAVALELLVTGIEEVNVIGIVNGVLGGVVGYDLIRGEEVGGVLDRSLALLSALPGIPSAIRHADNVGGASRAAARSLDAAEDSSRVARGLDDFQYMRPCPIGVLSCFTAGTLISTEHGLRPIEEI